MDDELLRLNYPSALHWMWNYCTYVGPYEHDGQKYDMGVYIHPNGEVSAAIVTGNEPGDYMSGDLIAFCNSNPIYAELLSRCKAAGIMSN